MHAHARASPSTITSVITTHEPFADLIAVVFRFQQDRGGNGRVWSLANKIGKFSVIFCLPTRLRAKSVQVRAEAVHSYSDLCSLCLCCVEERTRRRTEGVLAFFLKRGGGSHSTVVDFRTCFII